MLYNLLKPLAAFWKPKNVQIYDNVFNLHGKFTVGLLVIFSLIVSIKEYFGDPIKCLTDNPNHNPYVEYYCWIHGTYILKKYLNDAAGERMVTVGVGEYIRGEEHDRVYQKYYQWVVFILMLLAVMLHTPAFLWKNWEGGRMKSICQDFGSPITSPNWNSVENVRIVKYLRQTGHKAQHRYYAYRFFLCEVLNLIMVICAIWMLNVVFNDFWVEYGMAVQSVFHMETSGWTTNTARIFPKLAKCGFKRFGPSGSVESRDALCLLSLNIINEKIFAILWIWMPLLMVVSTLNIIYKMVLFSCAQFRMMILQSQVNDKKYRDTKTIKLITRDGDFGQWFIIYQLSRNVNPGIFQDIIRELVNFDKEKQKGKQQKQYYPRDHEMIEETV